jgi:uncharacterized protein (TIGR02265 family)
MRAPTLKGIFKTGQASASPTIKGMFVNSHVEALRAKLGDAAIVELERRLGRSVRFKSFDAVPVREEVRLIESALDILHRDTLSGSKRTAAAGRLHFTNFAETALGSALMHSLPHTRNSFKTLLRTAPSIARTVFSDIEFACTEHEDHLAVSINRQDYPLEHFQGFFEEWLHYWGLPGSVRAETVRQGGLVYRLFF